MDLELACVVCNWSRDLWESIGFGGFGAAAAAAAVAASGTRYEDRFSDDVGTATNSVPYPIPPIEDREAAYRAGQRVDRRFSRWAEKEANYWADAIWGTPEGGIYVVAGTAKDTRYAIETSADYDGRDYEQNPIEPPGPFGL